MPTPVIPVNNTECLTASNFSIRYPKRTVSAVGTSISKKRSVSTVFEGGYDSFPGIQPFGVKIHVNAPQVTRTGKLGYEIKHHY